MERDENVIILNMREQLLSLKNEALALIIESETNPELEELRISFLGKKGKLNQLLKLIPNLSKEEKKDIGQLANEVKKSLEEAIFQQKNALLANKLSLIHI